MLIIFTAVVLKSGVVQTMTGALPGWYIYCLGGFLVKYPCAARRTLFEVGESIDSKACRAMRGTQTAHNAKGEQ